MPLLKTRKSVQVIVISPDMWTLRTPFPAVLANAPTDFELADFYRQATVFFFPSMFEGFGLPPLEAMARGTPPLRLCSSHAYRACGADPMEKSPYGWCNNTRMTGETYNVARGAVCSDQVPCSRPSKSPRLPPLEHARGGEKNRERGDIDGSINRSKPSIDPWIADQQHQLQYHSKRRHHSQWHHLYSGYGCPGL